MKWGSRNIRRLTLSGGDWTASRRKASALFLQNKSVHGRKNLDCENAPERRCDDVTPDSLVPSRKHSFAILLCVWPGLAAALAARGPEGRRRWATRSADCSTCSAAPTTASQATSMVCRLLASIRRPLCVLSLTACPRPTCHLSLTPHTRLCRLECGRRHRSQPLEEPPHSATELQVQAKLGPRHGARRLLLFPVRNHHHTRCP